MKLTLISSTLSLLFLSKTEAAPISASSLAGDLSDSCRSSAIGLVTGEFGTCTNVVDLVNIVSGTGSIVAPFNTFLNGLCSSTCSNATLQATISTIESACSSDLAEGNILATGLDGVAKNYDEVKNVLCLQSTANSSFCLTNLLQNIESSTNTSITSSFLTSLLSDGMSSVNSFLSSIPASAVCNDCLQGLITQAQPLITQAESSSSSSSSSSVNSTLATGVSSKCGSSKFTDGTLPKDVRVGTSSGSSSNVTSSSANTSGAAGLNIRGEGKIFSSMIVVVTLVGAGLLV